MDFTSNLFNLTVTLYNFFFDVKRAILVKVKPFVLKATFNASGLSGRNRIFSSS